MADFELELFGSETIYRSGSVTIIIDDIDALRKAIQSDRNFTITDFETLSDSVLGGEVEFKARTPIDDAFISGTIDYVPDDRQQVALTQLAWVQSKLMQMNFCEADELEYRYNEDTRYAAIRINRASGESIHIKIEKSGNEGAAGAAYVELFQPIDSADFTEQQIVDVLFAWGAVRSALRRLPSAQHQNIDIAIKSLDANRLPAERDLVFTEYRLRHALGKRTVPELVVTMDEEDMILKAFNPTKQILEIVLKEIEYQRTETYGETDHAGIITTEEIVERLNHYYDD